jgi:hypothetical protein
MAKKPFVIRNDDELKAAIERRDELFACTNGNDGERELKQIADAIKVYTDAMRVLRNVDHGEPDLQAAQLRGKE